MHSSETLTSADFAITVDGVAHSHADWFRDLSPQRRLGVVAPGRVDAVGAATLIMAHVTAFYDRYREAGEPFFVYPDYFSFQMGQSMASYGNFDIWPERKSLPINDMPGDRLDAITDRGVHILLVPDGPAGDHEFDSIQLASAARTIDTCYLYSPDGTMADADVTVSCPTEPLATWMLSVFATPALSGNPAIQRLRSIWETRLAATTTLTQSYRRVPLADALARL